MIVTADPVAEERERLHRQIARLTAELERRTNPNLPANTGPALERDEPVYRETSWNRPR